MKKILLSLLTIALVSVVAFGATRAYFSDTQSSTNNTFTAGTLDLELSDANEGWSNNVSSTWSSPANWAPGDKVTASIYLRNTGSIPAMAVYANWNNLVDPNGMSNYIEVTWLSDSTDATNNIAAFRNRYDAIANGGNGDGKLSLAELVHGVGSSSTPPPFQARFYADSDESYAHPVLLANGGNVFQIRLDYQFMPTAGNDLQGKSASFDLTLQAAQHPYGH